jgi:peroxiredoxin
MIGLPVALLVACAPVTAQSNAGQATTVGQQAPVLSLPSLDDCPVDLGRYIGKVPVVLHFFAMWCSHCRAQMPSLMSAVERYGDSVKFIGVAVSASQSREQARRYAETHRMTHEILYDAQGEAVDAYRVPTTSYVVVIDARGRIAFTGWGPDLDIVAATARGL